MKNNKGFTLIEVIVSFSLICVVMVFLLNVIYEISKKNTEYLEEENFSIYEETLLKKIYEDIDNASSMTITESNNKIVFTSDDYDGDKILKFTDNSIIYDGTIYEMPSTMTFNKYELITRSDYYLIKINVKVGDTDKIMKFVKFIKS